MKTSDVFAALPKQCHLAAQVRIDDHMMHRGIPQEYITAQLSRELGRHLEQKSSTFVKREDRSNPSRHDFGFNPGTTVYTAEVFVFSEEELKAFAKKIYQHGRDEVTEHRVGIEVQLQVGTAKTELKKKLKATIDKALD
jgi:hypothetical protein